MESLYTKLLSLRQREPFDIKESATKRTFLRQQTEDTKVMGVETRSYSLLIVSKEGEKDKVYIERLGKKASWSDDDKDFLNKNGFIVHKDIAFVEKELD